MKQTIMEHIDDPVFLEQLYRKDKQNFVSAFSEIPDDFAADLVRFWKLRLAPECESEVNLFLNRDLWVVIALSLFTGILVKLPNLFSGIQADTFYARNLAMIVFNGIILFTFWQYRLFEWKKLLVYGLSVLIVALFVNLLPLASGDSIILALMHLPLLMWGLWGLVFIRFDHHAMDQRIGFIRFNGELLIMTGLILIAGAILAALTLGLFSAIDVSIEEFYLEYVVVFGSVAAPIISFYLIQLYPTITSRIAPVIARIFTPLVVITLTIYLISLIAAQSKILEDRGLLLLFNIMLLAVMAIIVFSISQLDKSKDRNVNILILFLLAGMAIIVNGIALTAIITRLTHGFTPNRTVVLGSNLLIFINLILIARNLFRAYFHINQLDSVEKTIAQYLPVYLAWTLFVIFALPFIFGMK